MAVFVTTIFLNEDLKEKMKKLRQKLIVICIVILCAAVFPIPLVRKNRNMDPSLYDGSYEITDFEITELTQEFEAQTYYLEGIAIDVGVSGERSEEGSLSVSLKGKGEKTIAEERIPIWEVNDEAYTYVSVKRWLRKGEVYSVTVTAEMPEGFRTVYTVEAEADAPGSRNLFLDGAMVEGQAAIRYVYGFPLNIKNVLCLWAFILTVGLSVLELAAHRGLGENRAVVRKAEAWLNRFQIPLLFLEFAAILLLVLRICRNEAVHWDEAYTWQIVTKNDLPGMLKATAADVHPPLYYMLVMAAMRVFGESIFVAKMVSVVGMAATCLLGITLVRKRWSAKAALLFLPAAGLGPQFIYFNVDVRMYSWMIFFVLAAGLSAYEILQSGKGRWWVGFTLFSLGGVYTQYFAVVPLAFLYLFLLIWFAARDRVQIKKWLGCCLATVAGYLPWLAVVIDTLQRDSAGVMEEKAGGLSELCEWAFGSNLKFSEYMAAVLFALAALWLVLEWKKYERMEKAFLVFAGLIFPLTYGVCMLLASRMNHFWHNRYLVDALLFVWLFFIIVMSRRGILVWCTCAVWLCASVLSSYTVMSATEMNTVPWTQQARELLAQVQEEEKIVYTYWSYDVIYQYWLPKAEFIWYEDADFGELGDEFYVVAWGGGDFPHALYENGTLTREVLGQMRLEEGVAGVELWKISVHSHE